MIKPGFSSLLPLALLGALVLVPLRAEAQDAQRAAEREIARRQAAVPQGMESLARAKVAMQAHDYARAYEEYRTAASYLPAANISGEAREEAVQGFCTSGIKIAEIRVQEGKYAEAESICREILSDRFDPNCRPAQRLLASLREPGRINRTMGPKFIEKVEEVRKLLTDADGYYNSGRYDLAFK
ncbi:MAG: hypothetical protein M3Y80_04030, partial [Verrucomicrobiota bacterium]|nr:hypothetical protein [Verrucomicrobiota bacterium]